MPSKVLHHFGLDLVHGADKNEYVLNPLAWSCQMFEDYVGRPSRLSRRVNIRQLHSNTIDRVLAAVETAFNEQ